jgi:hypothetical protein
MSALSRTPSAIAIRAIASLWRVTSFRAGEPTGHREYDALDGGGPIQRAFQEFASQDFVLTQRSSRQSPTPPPAPKLTALCIRARVVGTGNSFEVLIPLAEINPGGQTYRIIRDNREYVPFHLGIEPYTSEIIKIPPGFERYERYKAHEKAAKAKELSILQYAFP